LKEDETTKYNPIYLSLAEDINKAAKLIIEDGHKLSAVLIHRTTHQQSIHSRAFVEVLRTQLNTLKKSDEKTWQHIIEVTNKNNILYVKTSAAGWRLLLARAWDAVLNPNQNVNQKRIPPEKQKALVPILKKLGTDAEVDATERSLEVREAINATIHRAVHDSYQQELIKLKAALEKSEADGRSEKHGEALSPLESLVFTSWRHIRYPL
jgi:hypothetical protein